jgi:RNAse (barnase) inhibitor barstar
LVRSGAGGVYAVPGGVPLDAAVAQEAAAAGRRLIRLGASGAAGKDAFLDRAAASLALPAHFGRNWDALHDCLTDEPVLLGGAVLLVDGVDALAAHDPEALATALDVLRAAADYWTERGRPLLILVQPAEAATGVATVAI